MKIDYTNENFEDYLKQSADGLRMRAPDKIWKNISGRLAQRRRRIIAGGALLLLLSGGAAYLGITDEGSTVTTGEASNHATPVVPLNPSASKNQQVAFPSNTASTENKIASALPGATSSTVPTSPASANGIYKTPANMPARQPGRVVSIKQATNRSSNNTITKPAFVGETEVPATSVLAFTPTVVDSDPEPITAATQPASTKPATVFNPFPLTIESVTNTYKRPPLSRKLGFQFYFSPTVSYRKLTENKSYLRSAAASGAPVNYAAQYGNVASAVTHKPDVGFELGLTTRYPISKRLTLLTGLQFNVNRYDVKAFSASTSVTTIALNSRDRGMDSLNAVSGFSNVNGYKANWLQNFYFQVSAPIGAEYVLKTSQKASIGFAATIQPTYLLGDKAYLISTDYKNYALVPSLTRRWNVNTAFETFVTYKSGNTRWQVGPQVRYQLLSSFINEYPVKENLFDFGLKLGLSLNKY